MSTRRRRPVKKINKNMKKKLAVLFSLVVLALVGLVADISGGTWGVARNFCIFLTKDRALLT